ncbi:MAG: hypothetical protein EPN22_07130 [Nitrospirae bacterium]|nr:MAG: hypothetical protein EPN22_07130 [Nitrospirota bacterium]
MALFTASGKIETISPDKAKEWLSEKKEGEVTILDVRQPQEYISGHIPGAVFIPLPELIDRTGELDASKPVLTYCRLGNRSRSAAAILLSDGFRSALTLDGGINAWNGFVAKGDYAQGMYLLKGGETTEELITLAWSLEDGSRLFYEKASGLTADNESREIFSSLMEAEARHKDHILAAYSITTGNKIDAGSMEKAALKGVMESGVQVEEVISLLQEKGAALQDILEVSMQMEANALDLYVKMLREIKDNNAGKIFESLIAEEKKHLSRLGKLLGEKTRPKS